MRIPSYKSTYLILTNKCNSNCSFCYRNNGDGTCPRPEIVDGDMTVEIAHKIMNFLFDNIRLRPSFAIFFWGGEPLLKFDVIKSVMETYPQFYYNMSSNGIAVNDKVRNFFRNRMINFTWSVGSAYEKYGGIQETVAALPATADMVRDHEYRVNFMVTNFEEMYNDFRFLYENVTKKITIDIEIKGYHSDEDLDLYVKNYVRLLRDYDFGPDSPINNAVLAKSPVWLKSRGMLSKDAWLFCRSGLDRIFIDPSGGIWQCDGFYLHGKNKLGDVERGIDYTKLSSMWELADNLNGMSKYCDGCELYGICPRKKCLGLNIKFTGDMLKPYPNYCRVNKALVRIAKEHMQQLNQEVSIGTDSR